MLRFACSLPTPFTLWSVILSRILSKKEEKKSYAKNCRRLRGQHERLWYVLPHGVYDGLGTIIWTTTLKSQEGM